MNLVSLFSTPLFVDYLDIDNQQIIDFCYDHRTKNPHRNEDGGYQSLNLNLNNPNLSPLFQEITRRVRDIKKNYFSLKDECNLEITNSWFNINEPMGRCKGPSYPHLHTFRFLSCVYYPQAEKNSGNIVLLSPSSVAEYAIPNQVKATVHEFNSSRWTVEPEPSKLLIFPGWLAHYVEFNESNKDRISIVANISINSIEQIINTVF